MLAVAPFPAFPANYLIVLLDDVGVDKVGAYAEAPEPPPTPTLDALARQGVLFRNAWANPACSPTRAAALTGRRAELTGLGKGIPPGPGLDTDELTIADVLGEAGYATAAIGKWHLEHDPEHPLNLGFDTHRGSRSNVGPGGYWNWRKFIDGVDQRRQTTYATTDTANDAIAWIEAQTRPWFVWLSFNSPHLPLHAPPSRLHTRGDLVGATFPEVYAAMLEAVDTELARVLAAVDSDTTIIVMGDNGSYAQVIEPPFDSEHGKRSVYQGGVRVPLIVAGADVPAANRGAESGALVQATDLFATIAELVRSSATADDSVSFAPQLADAAAPGRSMVYTSWFRPNGGPPDLNVYARAARGARYKLIRTLGSRQELYDLVADPHESEDLLLRPLTPSAETALGRLSAFIDAHEWGRSTAERRAPDGRAAWVLIAAAAATIVLGVLLLRLRRRASPAVDDH